MPSIDPAQVVITRGEHLPAWQGHVVIAHVRNQSVQRIRLDADRVVFDERISIGQRVQDLVDIEDGRLFFVR